MASLRERLLKQKEDLKNRSAGGKFFTIKEGTTRFRILPTGDEKDWGLEVIYFYLGKDIGGIVSPATFGKKCAIQKEAQKFKDSKSEDDREWAKKNFRAARKFFVLAAKYKDEKGKEIDTEAGEKPLLLTPSQYQELLEMWLDEDTGDFTDVKNGYDIKFSRTGKTMTDTEYTMRRCDRSPLAKIFAKKAPFDLEAEVKKLTPSYEESKEILEKFLQVKSSALEDDDEEEDTPKKKKTGSSTKKKKRSKDL